MEFQIGAKIKKLRKARKLTLQDVARETGFSPALISQIENNNVSPPIATLSKLANFFDVKMGHFFEDELARSDSIGGRHFIPGTVEARVAFGEGWGNAIAAIASNRPRTCDTAAPGSSGSELDVEIFNSNADEQGFFNEMSVATFLYDLFDTGVDGSVFL